MFTSFKPVVYVQISPDRLTVRNVKSGEAISEIPEVAISGTPKSKVLGVGARARVSAADAGTSASIVNPFAHPRTLVSDFTVAEHLIKEFLRRLLGTSLLSISPVIVVHPLGDPAGGFTQVELRAFRELAVGAGASEVIVWLGHSLTDQEILSRTFPSDGKVEA